MNYKIGLNRFCFLVLIGTFIYRPFLNSYSTWNDSLMKFIIQILIFYVFLYLCMYPCVFYSKNWIFKNQLYSIFEKYE